MINVIGFIVDFLFSWLPLFLLIYIGIRIYAKIRKLDDYSKIVKRGGMISAALMLFVTAINTYTRVDNPALQPSADQRITENYQTEKQPHKDVLSHSAEDWTNMGYDYAQANRYDDAINALNKAIELNPNYVLAYGHRGTCYSRVGNHSRAIDDFSKAIEINPSIGLAYDSRGLSYMELGRYKDAIADFDKAINLNSGTASTFFNRGTAYAFDGNNKRAIEDFNKSLRLQPNDPLVYYNMGLAHAKLSQYQNAITAFDQAIRLKPNYTEAYGNRGLSYFGQGKNALGCNDVKKTCELGDCKALEWARNERICN